jgi:hypothetical protein
MHLSKQWFPDGDGSLGYAAIAHLRQIIEVQFVFVQGDSVS